MNLICVVNAIKHSDKFVHFYTGLENYSVFLHAFWSLGENFSHLKFAYSGRCDWISPENQFLFDVSETETALSTWVHLDRSTHR